MMLAIAALALAGCGGTGGQATAGGQTKNVAPSVALRLDTGSYTTSARVVRLRGTVVPGTTVTVNQTYPNGEGGTASVRLQTVRVMGNRWSATAALAVDQFGSAYRQTNTGINKFTVRAAKPGYMAAESVITITRAETIGEHSRSNQAAARRLKQEEANPNSEFNKIEREAEAEATKAKHAQAEEERPYREEEEKAKNLEAKKAEEIVEEEAREQRRLESEDR